MSAAGAIAAAAVAAADRQVMAQLRAAGAQSWETAVSFTPSKPFHTRRLQVLIKRGLIHEAAPGLYWVDEAAVLVRQAQARKAAKWLLAGVSVVALLAVGAAVLLTS